MFPKYPFAGLPSKFAVSVGSRNTSLTEIISANVAFGISSAAKTPKQVRIPITNCPVAEISEFARAFPAAFILLAEKSPTTELSPVRKRS